VAIPQPSILAKAIESMTHAEAEEETAEALALMIGTIREQTDHLAELLGLEESKVSTL